MRSALSTLILLVLLAMPFSVLALSDGVSIEYIPAPFNLGIGKISPAAKLDVNGTTATKALTLNGNSFSIAPSLSQGSLLFAKSIGTFKQLTKGTNHNVLKVNGNTLAWESISAGSGATSIDQLSDGKSNGGADVCLGNGACASQSSSSYSIALGIKALQKSTNSAVHNNAFGYMALNGNTSGNNNTVFGYKSLYANTSGSDNTTSGSQSLYSNISGNGNTVSGYQSLYSNINGNGNTASGYQSLYSNVSGDYNTVSGYRSLYSNTGGDYNTAVGHNSLYLNTVSDNTAIGQGSMYSNTTGTYNTGLGASSLYYNATGARNAAVGYMAGEGSLNNSFSNGSFLGYSAGAALTTGSNNTMLGYGAGIAVTNGNGNILLGYQAGDNIDTGARNIIIGYDVDAPSVSNRGQLVIGNLIYGNGMTATGTTISSGKVGINKANPAYTLDVNGMTFSKVFSINGNTLSSAANASQGSILFAKRPGVFAVLDNAASSNHKALTVNGNNLAWKSILNQPANSIDDLSDAKSNAYNVYLGNGAGAMDSGASYSTGVGIKALQNNVCPNIFNIGFANSALGYMALNGNGTGDYNTAAGYQSLRFNNTGTHNTAIGYQSLYSGDGSYNTASGYRALYSNSGFHNTASGYRALYSNTTGAFNIASGYDALYNNLSGMYNIAIGYNALRSATGYRNTAVGHSTNSTTASNGTLLGYRAGKVLTSGKNNILIGYQAGDILTSGSNNIIIGPDADPSSATSSNQINIGLTIRADTATGNVGIGVGTLPGAYKLKVLGTAGLSTGTAWTNTSDIRLKNIDGDYEYGLAEILKLHSVRFHYKEGNPREIPSDIPLIGFIAQEVQSIFPEAVNMAKDGYLDLNIHPISVAMVNAMQEFKQEKDTEISQVRKEHEQLRLYLCAKDPAAVFCKEDSL